MKITITAFLFAERDMNINQLVTETSLVNEIFKIIT